MNESNRNMPGNADQNVVESTEVGFREVAKSTFSAFLGVQSNANRERDFKGGKMSHFIVMGLIFGLIFVLSIVGVVQLVLHFTGH